MVACLPLIQQVQGSIPSGVVNFNLNIFNLGARRGKDVQLLIARCTSQAWNKFQTLPQNICWEGKIYCWYRFVRRKGALILADPLVFIDRSRLYADTGFHLLPSLHHHSIHNTLRLQNNYTYSHSNLTSFGTQIQIHIPHITWSYPRGIRIESRPH